jgi:hypothetical protein
MKFEHKSPIKCPEFSSLEPTMMVSIIKLSHTVNIRTLFNLLPVTIIPGFNYDKEYRKVPIYRDGCILSVRFENNTRGIKRIKKPLKNSISIDISINNHNICVRFNKDNMHITGAKSLEEIREISNYLFTYIRESNKFIELMNSRGLLITNYVKDNCMGKEVDIVMRYEEEDIIFCEERRCHLMNSNNFSIYCEDTKSNLDISLLYKYIAESSIYEDIIFILENTIGISSITSDDIHIYNIDICMINWNYNIIPKDLKDSIIINREGLSSLIHRNRDFYATFNNSTSSKLKIEKLTGDSKLTSKGKRKCHSFIVNMGGNITQSGPDFDKCKEVYEEFIQLLKSFSPEIIFTKRNE